MIRVRPTRGTDIGRLEAVERSAATLFRALPDLAWLAEDRTAGPEAHARAVAQGLSWVAVDEVDQPAGFLIAAVEDGADLHVLELSVAADHQGRGAGRALMQTARREAETRALSALTLTTFAGVAWNAPFYARLGYTALTAETTPAYLREALAAQAEHCLTDRVAMRLKL
ncbi:GNAT family N-acetyltransferase [Brevundimonas diminuta]|uniref:GNAT family N-acetyltransferase n=1 Tax=Brevundimonas diminuta TaxID=293 RepID=A0A410NTG0_BREDI|nr:GNAT family N-acetyltransferase [Brevundimonas diminuta]MBD3571565.1 GNAT family N-acetyltransferase [Brevundimonas diminuta]QAT13217.1 GNAT family N-acetyltransferase [Brevundimonas diminuta]QQB89431.1 GNAT family N-acetyltransferase [Brevundimonas diminuta]GEC01898.1 N-acetyltransferase GCN5 [Brevundimonas diminuta]